MTDLAVLKARFRDEDTTTWVTAANELGVRALTDQAARDFVAERMRDAKNIHGVRHALCALASYRSEAAADWAFLADEIAERVQAAFKAVIGSYLLARTVGELGAVPELRDEFQQWCSSTRDKLESRLTQRRAAGAPTSELDGIDAQLAGVAGLVDTSNVPQRFKPKAWTSNPPNADWFVASYLMGVRSRRALFGLPLDLLVVALTEFAAAKGFSGIGYAVAVPFLLRRLLDGGDLTEQRCATLAAEFRTRMPASWAKDPEHHNELLVDLSRLPGAPSALDVWSRTPGFPAWLAAELGALHEPASDGLPADRRAMRVLRRIQREVIDDAWAWAAASDGERLGLNAYLLLLIHGWGPFDPATPAASRLDIDARIGLVADALRTPCAVDIVYPQLVRTLKRLFHEQLRAASPEDVAATCRRHLSIARIAIAAPDKPATVNKDLATIVYRVLAGVWAVDRARVVELLYGAMYARPDARLWKEVRNYSCIDAIDRVVEAIVGAEAAIESGDVDRILAEYGKCADAVETIAPTGASARLPELVRILGRRPDAALRDDDERVLRGALRSIVRAGVWTRQPWSPHEAVSTDNGEALRPWEGASLSWSWEGVRTAGADGVPDAADPVESVTRSVLEQFRRALGDVAQLESECLGDHAARRIDSRTLGRWRELLAATEALEALCADHLPTLERRIVAAMLGARISSLRARLDRIADIFGRDDEAAAVRALASVGQPSRRGPVEAVLREYGDGQGLTPDPVPIAPDDAPLVQEWMLRRYMLRQIAAAHGLRVLGLLTSPRVMIPWILAPFVASGALEAAGHGRYSGLPFGLALVANVALMCAYAWETRTVVKRGNGLVLAGRFLLPQTAAALFMGITQVISTDESWSMAVVGNRFILLATIPALLVLGFFFTRDVLLDQQLQSRQDTRRRSRRARRIMVYSLWQSSALMLFFGILPSRLMAVRGQFGDAPHGSLWGTVGKFIPHEITVDAVFLRTSIDAHIVFHIFPWALILWTVQVFFFSVIFERVIQQRAE